MLFSSPLQRKVVTYNLTDSFNLCTDINTMTTLFVMNSAVYKLHILELIKCIALMAE